jgi:hypothetical protein
MEGIAHDLHDLVSYGATPARVAASPNLVAFGAKRLPGLSGLKLGAELVNYIHQTVAREENVGTRLAYIWLLALTKEGKGKPINFRRHEAFHAMGISPNIDTWRKIDEPEFLKPLVMRMVIKAGYPEPYRLNRLQFTYFYSSTTRRPTSVEVIENVMPLAALPITLTRTRGGDFDQSVQIVRLFGDVKVRGPEYPFVDPSVFRVCVDLLPTSDEVYHFGWRQDFGEREKVVEDVQWIDEQAGSIATSELVLRVKFDGHLPAVALKYADERPGWVERDDPERLLLPDESGYYRATFINPTLRASHGIVWSWI